MGECPAPRHCLYGLAAARMTYFGETDRSIDASAWSKPLPQTGKALWGRFLRRHQENALVAFYNMSPVIRVAANMFGIGLGLKLKAFAGEQQARVWLREMGIPA